MEGYDRFLLADPKPLVGLLGQIENEPDLHTRIITALDSSLQLTDGSEILAPITISSLPEDHDIMDKKEPREFPSFDGILKRDWLRKHSEIVPSVVLLLFPFNVDWSQAEWTKRESVIQERFSKWRSVMNTRDAKCILILVKTGIGLLDKDGLDDRLSSIKKLLQLDSKSFAFMVPSDFNPQSQFMKKFSKSVREYASAYYNSHIKRWKNAERVMPANRSNLDVILTARYNFKIAFFSEILGQKVTSLKHYRSCFQSLVEAVDILGKDWSEQVKSAAEYANFKICSMQLGSGAIKDASLQFRTHIARFLRVSDHLPWRHYSWLSTQFIVFAQLLNQYCMSENMAEADRCYYYLSAARFSEKRKESFEQQPLSIYRGKENKAPFRNNIIDPSLLPTRDEANISTIYPIVNKYKGMQMSSPRFVGSHPEVIDLEYNQPQPHNEELELLIRMFYEEQEIQVDHGNLIIHLLNSALKYIPASHYRRIAHVRSVMTDQFVSEGKYALAMDQLTKMSDMMISEGWIEPAIPLLKKRIVCATHLGKLQDFLLATLTLYANSNELLNRNDREELHNDVFSVICPKKVGKSVVDRAEYGKAATAETPAEQALPSGYVLGMVKPHSLFDTVIKFHNKVIEVGHSVLVTLSIRSTFLTSMAFTEMSVSFFGGQIVKCFRENGADSRGVNIPIKEDTSDNEVGCDSNPFQCSLVFPNNQYVNFTFPVFVPESYMQDSSADTLFGVENIRLTMDTGDVVFEIPTVSKAVTQKLETRTKSVIAKEYLHLFKLEKYSVVLVTKPKPLVELLSPLPNETVTFLQGTLQRLNLVFKTGKNYMLQSKCFLSGDILPKGNHDALFWYPAGIQNATGDDLFHPLQLGGNLQPCQPLLLQDQLPNSTLYIPLFLRSDHLGAHKVKVRLEYITKPGMESTVFREFEIKIQFVRPLHVNFSVVSHRDAPCGALREQVVVNAGSHNTHPVFHVIAGDVITMNASLKCLDALHSSIEVVDFRTHHCEEITETENSSKRIQGPFFSIANNAEFFSMVQDNTKKFEMTDLGKQNTAVSLFRGEAYVGSTDFRCHRMADSVVYPRVTMCQVLVDWKLRDDNFLNPLDMSKYSTDDRSNNGMVSVSLSDTDQPTEGSVKEVNLLSWLPPLSSGDDSALAKEVSITRLCTQVFMMPAVQILGAPFEVSMEIPSTAVLGSEMFVLFRVLNRNFSMEKIVIRCELHQDILITGATNYAMEISPKSSFCVALAMVPLKCGHVNLPHIQIVWERYPNVSVAEIGVPPSTKFVFVKPSGI